MISIRTFAFAAGAAIIATTAAAQDYMAKGEVEGWKIFLNEPNKACFAETTTEEGLIMQIGSDGSGEMAFVSLYTTADAPIHDGEKREVTIEVDGERFAGMAEGDVREGYTGGYFYANNPLLGFDLAAAQTMVVNPDGPNTYNVDLTGSAAAIDAVRACQMEANG